MDMIVGRGARYAGLVLRTASGLAPKGSTIPARCLCHCDSKRRDGRSNVSNERWRTAAGSGYLVERNLIESRIVVGSLFMKNDEIVARFSGSAVPQPSKDGDKEGEPPLPEKQTIFQKMKQLTKDYWHILIPVHVVTSIGWISVFYAAAKNGVDIVGIMEYLNLGERYLDLMRGSTAGHWAVTYALYKLATPVRYTVTVGGTTMSIRYLNKMGYLKFKPRSTIKETQSSTCGAEQREKIAKTGYKSEQQTEPPKT